MLPSSLLGFFLGVHASLSYRHFIYQHLHDHFASMKSYAIAIGDTAYNMALPSHRYHCSWDKYSLSFLFSISDFLTKLFPSWIEVDVDNPNSTHKFFLTTKERGCSSPVHINSWFPFHVHFGEVTMEHGSASFASTGTSLCNLAFESSSFWNWVDSTVLGCRKFKSRCKKF